MLCILCLPGSIVRVKRFGVKAFNSTHPSVSTADRNSLNRVYSSFANNSAHDHGEQASAQPGDSSRGRAMRMLAADSRKVDVRTRAFQQRSIDVEHSITVAPPQATETPAGYPGFRTPSSIVAVDDAHMRTAFM